LLLGLLVGFILHMALRRRRRSSEIFLIVLGTAFLSTALAISLHLSPLLMNMVAGAVMINMSSRHHQVFKSLEPLTPPLYALFFVLAGSELRLSVLTQPLVLLIGLAYLVARAAGKYCGTFLGAAAGRAPPTVRTYLGLCMFPQAGVSLGLALFVQAAPVSALMSVGQQAMTATLVNVILLSVLVNQFIGPPFAKLAIQKGNDMESTWN